MTLPLLVRVHPRDIRPGQRVLRRIFKLGIIRTDEFVCAENEYGVIVNPRGVRLAHDEAEWYAWRDGTPELTQAISILAKLLSDIDPGPNEDAAEPDPPKPQKPGRRPTRFDQAVTLIGQGWTLDEILAEMHIGQRSLYSMLHKNHRTDLWKRLRGKVS